MAISGSPKKLAQDIAGGFTSLSQSGLKQYTPADLKTILTHLAIVTRELRAEQIPLEDVPAVKAKNMKLSRLNQAAMVVRAYAKKRRIPL
ncbi:hypothetical protein C2E25_10350 [Geothermobacter hydrogeniphilus]|uniref:Uncharacterized protein n=1 Tax=Geothermobacter hydrogeniphilus TaxID=1969733 RepID=A0A2K2H929_9BACT|nr:hypothetical protein [Geothermobacter hydrogeniphilus]PNU19825.1 hypothetical protein C2E25_10350 [Geothermobacter hydrogeniphilus]